MRRREWFTGLRDWLKKNRNTIIYVNILCTLIGVMVGWNLLPDMVTLEAAMENPTFQPKERPLVLHLFMGTLFSGLFWKWPRELAYALGIFLHLLLLVALLYGNLVVL